MKEELGNNLSHTNCTIRSKDICNNSEGLEVYWIDLNDFHIYNFYVLLKECIFIESKWSIYV
jgi:hypothetical protein